MDLVFYASIFLVQACSCTQSEASPDSRIHNADSLKFRVSLPTRTMEASEKSGSL